MHASLLHFIDFTKMKDTLDSRYSEKNKKECVLVAKKTRTEGPLSTAAPRTGAPQWIVKTIGKSHNHVDSLTVFSLADADV